MNEKPLRRETTIERSTTGDLPSRAEMEKLIGLFNSGQLASAENEVRLLIGRYKKAAELYNILGRILTDQNKLEEALDCYIQLAKLKPRAPEVLIKLGNAYQYLHRVEEAIATYRRALKIKPDFVDAHNNLGASLASQGQFAEAVISYRQAIEIKPDYAQSHNNLGNALRDLGELEEAKTSLHRALEINPKYPAAYYNLHSMLLDDGDLTAAIKCMENAVSLEPKNANYRLFLGMLLEYSGDEHGGETHLKQASQGSELVLARLDAWNYFKTTGAKMIGSYLNAFRLGLDAARDSGLVLEFGVRFGSTIRQIAALTGQQVHGFDSFEGLPEAWHHEGKGSYSTKGMMPLVPDNVTLHKGWFKDTLPVFLKSHREPVRFINVDCDLYSATKTIFDNLAAQIVAGTVIVFDEYIGNAHWREDEFKAFQEAVTDYGWKYDYLAFSLFTKQAIVRIQ